MTLSDRDPFSREGAIAHQVTLLGAKEAAFIVGKGLTTIYRATSEREAGTLNELERLRLDAACLAKHGTTPYLDYQKRLIEQMAIARDHEPKPAEIAALDLGAAVGNVQHATAQAKCPNGDGGRKWTPRERKHAIELALDAKKKLDAFILAVNVESGANVVSLPVDGKVK